MRIRISLPMSLVYAILLWSGSAFGQNADPASQTLNKAVQLIAQTDHAGAIRLLQGVVAETPSEFAYYLLGNTLAKQADWEKASAAYEEGAAKFPLSARLHYAAGYTREQLFHLEKALPHYRLAHALDPMIISRGGGRYDPEFDAVFIPAMHDHRGARNCQGRLFVNEQEMHFVVYITTGGDDDSFKAKYADLDSVEADRKTGAGGLSFTSDYSIVMLLTNLTNTRRLILPDEFSRLDLKFAFRTPISGYRSNWKKEDFKLFFLEPKVGELFQKFLESKKVKMMVR